MKRKVFTVLCVLALVLLPLVASAGMYGLYRGYPIANVYVDGNKVTSDVPAFVMDGRTMVPLRFVSDALGAGVSWDGSTQSARITRAQQTVNELQSLTTLKLYSKISNHYKILEMLGEELNDLCKGLALASDEISHNNSNSFLTNSLFNAGTSTIEHYNSLLPWTTSIINEASRVGVDITDMNNILNKYYTAIDYYKQSYADLQNFYVSRSYQSGYNSLHYSGKLFDTALEGKGLAHDGYMKFYSMLQAY